MFCLIFPAAVQPGFQPHPLNYSCVMERSGLLGLMNWVTPASVSGSSVPYPLWPPHFSAVGGALRGLAGPGCSRQMGLRPWLGSKPYRYPPLYACTSGKGEGFTDAWPSLVLSPEDFTQVALTPH